MKKSLFSLALVLVLGLAGQSFAGWSSLTVLDVRVVQTTTGKRICVITPVSGGMVGFEIQAPGDEKMVELAMKAVEFKTTAWIFALTDLPTFTQRGDSKPYGRMNDISGFVLTKP